MCLGSMPLFVAGLSTLWPGQAVQGMLMLRQTIWLSFSAVAMACKLGCPAGVMRTLSGTRFVG